MVTNYRWITLKTSIRTNPMSIVMASNFVWYELMTPYMADAEAFYKAVVGWKSEQMPGMPYTIMKVGDTPVAGVMTIPDQAKAMGQPPAWMGYIYAADVDKATNAVKAAGGNVFRAPDDIPSVGRFSVVADPQGAAFMLFQPAASAGASSMPWIGKKHLTSTPASSAGRRTRQSTWARWGPTSCSRSTASKPAG